MRILSLFTLLAATMLTGCDVELDGWDGNNDKFKKDFRFSYSMKPGATFSLENMNGSVDVAGWDRNEVEITGVQYGRTEAARDAVKIEITHSDTAATVRTVTPLTERQESGARYVVRLPRKVTLDRIVTSNGKVHIGDIEGAVKMKTSNGAVDITKITGAVDAQSTNGGVDANQITGAAHLHTSNGHIHAESVKGPIEATSSNGGIVLTLNEGLGGEIHASTSNASITVKMGTTAVARVRASTSNGRITSAFDTDSRGGDERRHWEGSVNGATASSPLVDLSTSNGAVRIEKL